jgi:hypothetical protein
LIEQERKDIVKSSGFSFIEMILALTLLLVVLASIFSIVSNVQKKYRQQIGTTQARANIRRVLEFLTREVSRAGANGVGGIAAGSNTTMLHLTGDFGGCAGCPYNEYTGLDPKPDKTATQRDEDLTFTFTPSPDPNNGLVGKLTRYDAFDPSYRVGGTLSGAPLPQIIADRIKNLEFKYYDCSNNLLPVPLSTTNALLVCKIDIAVSIVYAQRKAGAGLEDLTQQIKTSVVLQNNRTNLNRF